MAVLTQRRATYADLDRVPQHLVAEIIDGMLHTQPRPAPRHAVAAARLSGTLGSLFDLGQSGPNGWIFMVEPELHFGDDIVVPDLAGWRRERLPVLPETAFLETEPDWVCEILSPSTEFMDRGAKRRTYAGAGVAHLWLLDPRSQILEAFQLSAGRWLLTGVAAGGEDVRLPPFDSVSFSLSQLFPFDPPLSDQTPSQG